MNDSDKLRMAQLFDVRAENKTLRERIEQLERQIETMKDEMRELALGDDW